jgi:DNA sulfur modification protein DndB
VTPQQAFFYEFAAIRGYQAGHPYFVAMCPLNVIPKIFDFREDELSADARSQRILDRRRIPEIAEYIVENHDSYAFSSITASIDGDVSFEPVAPNQPDLGRLKVDMASSFHINDGQHRRAAIEMALEQRPELGSETISVVFYPDLNLTRRQQLFADLNKNAVRPTSSLNVLYDQRNTLAGLTRELVHQLPVFKTLTELERNSISHTSRKLFTLSAIHQATAKFLGKTGKSSVEDCEIQRAKVFWQAVIENMPAWEQVRRGRLHAGELRRDEIQCSGLALQAIAFCGVTLIETYPNDWVERLEGLRDIDWTRSNAAWEGRALHSGVLKKSRSNVILTSNILKHHLNLPLSIEEVAMEERHV